MATSTTLAINKTLYKKLPYDPVKDFTPIALVAGVPFALIVNPSIPAKTLAEFIAYAKSTSRTGLWLGRQRQSAASRRRDAEGRSGDRHPACVLPRQRAGDARRDRGAYSLHGGGPAAGAAADRARQGQGSRRDHAEAGRRRAGHSDARRKRACRVSSLWHGRAWLAPAGLPRTIVDQLAAQIEKLVADPAIEREVERRLRWSRCPAPRRTVLRLISRPRSIAGP